MENFLTFHAVPTDDVLSLGKLSKGRPRADALAAREATVSNFISNSASPTD